jgi:hypothetical protein
MSILHLEKEQSDNLVKAVVSAKRVSGHTHTYYRYPARFSPEFIRNVIETFTDVGDLVIDPFVGGGTTLVEARSLGRQSLGIDLNNLAAFVSKVKTSILTNEDIDQVKYWSTCIPEQLSLNYILEYDFLSDQYFKNLNSPHIWPIRNSISLAIDAIEEINSKKHKNFLRCALLKTSQWALESRKHTPSASIFRDKLQKNINQMIDSNREYRTVVSRMDKLWKPNGNKRTTVLSRPTQGIESDVSVKKLKKPSLIITSPPYPGVHVLYHRWQVNGRRETPIAYKIANVLDGSGSSYYTFGDRHEENLTGFFTSTYKTFKSLANISSDKTIVAQMIAFSDISWQLPLYLETMQKAGFEENKIHGLKHYGDGRIWRDVPNRKWHATLKGKTQSSKEVVLFHKLR